MTLQAGTIHSISEVALWVRDLEQAMAKYLRQCFETAAAQGPRVMLKAWANHQRLGWASLPVDITSNRYSLS